MRSLTGDEHGHALIKPKQQPAKRVDVDVSLAGRRDSNCIVAARAAAFGIYIARFQYKLSRNLVLPGLASRVRWHPMK